MIPHPAYFRARIAGLVRVVLLKLRSEAAVQQASLATDGGAGEGRASATAVLCLAKRKFKLAAMLGPCTSQQAELIGLLLGLAFLRLRHAGPISVRWTTDSDYVAKGTMLVERWKSLGWRSLGGRPIEHRALWEAFLELAEDMDLTVNLVRSHSGVKDNERCDRACRWVLHRGSRLLKRHGEGPVGQLAKTNPSDAWHLLDGRRLLETKGEEEIALRAARLIERLEKP